MNSELFCSGGKQTALVCVLASSRVTYPIQLSTQSSLRLAVTAGSTLLGDEWRRCLWKAMSQ